MSEFPIADLSICRCGDQLTAAEVYAIWKIRDAVFAFEQHVEDVDVDGLDLRPDTTHIWLGDDSGPTSYLRLLTGEGYLKVGRVCTRKDRRGQGLASRLMKQVSYRFGAGILNLNAQAYLEHWYERFGYVRSGPNFDEAGIHHVPMTRVPSGSSVS